MKKSRIKSCITAIVFAFILSISVVAFSACASGNNDDESGRTNEDTLTLTFNATVANGIPQGTNISIGSSLNTWNPKNTEWFATQIDNTHFSLAVTLDKEYIGQEIEYKWTLQYPNSTGNGWEYTENAAGSGLYGNRKYKIKDKDNVINDNVSFPNEAVKVQSTLTCGKLETIEINMPQFPGRKRTVRVWLPEGYDAQDRNKKYSVLYMHDGQNLFDAATSFLGEWEIDETLTKLMNVGYESTIVVGIDNGELERFNELSPTTWELSTLGKDYISAPAGDKYADFIVNTVKPYIDGHFNTKPQCKYTGIGGSSMGGIMSLYMAMKYADVFDYGIVFSPAMHVYKDDVLQKFFNGYNFDTMQKLPKLYLFAGAQKGGSEAGTPYDETCITKYVDIIKNYLTDRNYPEENICTLIDQDACHIESDWAKNFPGALEWLSEARKNDD